MSFILDALRKSETERQRQSGPGLVDAGYRPPASRRAVWLPVLVVVLLANLAAMAFIWLRRPAAPPAAAASATAPTAAPVTAEPAAPAPVTPAAAVAAADSEIAFATTADMPALDARAGTGTEVLEPPPPRAGGTAETAVAPGIPARPGAVQEGLPSADELIARGELNVPAMHLDIHVFSTDPAGRFVFINMRKYAEGAVLSEGPTLEEITREGAVLSQNGRRFVLNRD